MGTLIWNLLYSRLSQMLLLKLLLFQVQTEGEDEEGGHAEVEEGPGP